MAFKRQVLLIFLTLLSLLTFSFAKNTSQVTGGIGIYWGQNKGGDDTLASICDTGNYDIVLLAFLNNFGCGRTLAVDFDGHCGVCTKLQSEIEHCQQKGVKVFLSLGGPSGSYSICSPKDAIVVANYLYDNFLSGQNGPLGNVSLDGIDFDIQNSSNLHWDDLVNELDGYRYSNKYFYLSAAPQCFMPDYHLDKAIQTGLFDYIFVQFYNNPSCQYSSDGSTKLLFQSWRAWTYYVQSGNTVFMGLPAAPNATKGGGYISPENVTSLVLPYIKQSSNYGGVILWDRSADSQTQFSNQIKPNVTKSVLQNLKAIY